MALLLKGNNPSVSSHSETSFALISWSCYTFRAGVMHARPTL